MEHKGYTVVAAGDLGQAVARIKECPPDLLNNPNLHCGLVGARRSDVFANEMPEDEGSYSRGLLDDERLQSREALQGFEVFPRPCAPAKQIQEVKHILSKPPRG